MKQQIEIDVPEGYEVEIVGEITRYDTEVYRCVYFRKKQPEFIEVREYLYRNPYGEVIPYVVSKKHALDAAKIELSVNFIKWLDKDWRKVEV